LNGFQIDAVEADVFRYLQDSLEAGQRFDVVILDPPPRSLRAKRMSVEPVRPISA
jgi:23S rRNA G2069 N7-methylase RlmK/C1962 C5-methylase RlmI